jgi:hypothetical protein
MAQHSGISGIVVCSPAMRGGVAQNSSNSAEDLPGSCRTRGPNFANASSHRCSIDIRNRYVGQHREGPSFKRV